MKKLFFVVVLFSLCINTTPALAQNINFKKVLGLPEVMKRPIKRFDLSHYNKRVFDEKSRKIAWEVYSDRSDNKTSNGKTLEFKERFFVVDEKATAIRIIKAKLDNLKIIANTAEDFGWVDKEKMLLWSDGLLDATSKINLKGFLLNNKSSIEDVLKGKLDKERVVIYDSPDIENAIELGHKRIYKFFFIFKEIAINESLSMYLLCKEVKIRNGNTNVLVGWVRSNRVTPWNTRFALEPNFDPIAFTERKNNVEDLSVKLFLEAKYALDYAQSQPYLNDGVEANDPIWEDDPVKFSQEKLAEGNQISETYNTDTCRFKGGVVRFPMLKSKQDYFETAFVGDLTAVEQGKIMGAISDEKFADLTENLDKRVVGNNNINVLFIVDGTNGMKQYIKAVYNAIGELKSIVDNKPDKTIKFGAAVYGDLTANEFEVEKMDENENKVIDFLKRIEAKPKINENSPYESLFFGIEQALAKARLNKNHLNIVVIVGDAGENENGESISSQVKVQKSLKAWNAHVLAFNSNVTGGKPGADFKNQMEKTILETAKRIYDDYKYLTRFQNYNIKPPELVMQKLKGGVTYGSYTDLSNALSIERILVDEVEKAISKADQLINLLIDFVYNGNAIPKNSAGTIGPAFGSMIGDIEFTEEELKNLAYEKYQFYLEAYAPIKIDGARNNSFSYVLFMPENDLRELIGRLDRLAGFRDATSKGARQGVIDTWCELLRIYTGESDRQACLNYTPEDINKMIQGIEDDLISIGSSNLSFLKLKKVKSDRNVPDAIIRDYVIEILKKAKVLKKIYDLGTEYEFSYTSNGNTYYWIPIQFLP